MGLELLLLPIEGADEPLTLSGNFLSCERDYDLFDEIDKLPSTLVPPNYKFYYPTSNAYGYGKLTKTLYGGKLTCVYVKDLLKCKPYPESHINRAIWAYLRELPPKARFALYWC